MTGALSQTGSDITPTQGTVQSLFSVGWMGTRSGLWFDPVRSDSTGTLMQSPVDLHSWSSALQVKGYM